MFVLDGCGIECANLNAWFMFYFFIIFKCKQTATRAVIVCSTFRLVDHSTCWHTYVLDGCGVERTGCEPKHMVCVLSVSDISFCLTR